MGKKGQLYIIDIKLNSNCKQEEKTGEGPGSCSGGVRGMSNRNEKDIMIPNIRLATKPLNINNTMAYKNVYNNIPIKITDRNNEVFYDYVLDQQDNFQNTLIDENEFNKLPTIVSKSDMDNLISENKVIEIYRGVDNKKYSDQLKYGKYVLGHGISGDGIYSSVDKKAASDYTYNNKDGDVMRMALPKEAKIIAYSDLVKEREFYIKSLKQSLEKSSENDYNKNSKEYRIIEQMTKMLSIYAIIKGYDAIRTGNIILVLNRRALYIQNDDN